MQIQVPDLADDLVALRAPEPGDVDAVYLACQDPEIPRWTRVPSPYTRESALEYVARAARGWDAGTDASFVIVDRRSDELVGTIGVHRLTGEERGPEVGYWVRREARGHGVATRALRLVAGWVRRELGAPALLLQADVRNTSSRRVAEKAGFRHVGEGAAPEGCGECETMAVYTLPGGEADT
jgi:RimJ/RimL family protein N-acetyltransferase